MKKPEEKQFSIYLLQEKYSSPKQVLIRGRDARIIKSNPPTLPDGSELYVCKPRKGTVPWWANYWKIKKPKRFERPAKKSLLVFIPAGGRIFALTFGYARHYLNIKCCVERFGFLVALNSIDRRLLKSFQINKIDSSLRFRVQANSKRDFNAFDLQEDKDLWLSLAGVVKEEYRGLFDWASGRDVALRCTSHLEAGELINLLKKLLGLYESEEYKHDFPEIDKIVPTNDDLLEKELDERLLKAIKEKDHRLEFALPVMLRGGQRVAFHNSSERHRSMNLDDFYNHLRDLEDAGKKFNLSYLKSRKKLRIFEEDELEETARPLTLLECFMFHTESADNKLYYLNSGQWYKIQRDFIKDVTKFVNQFYSHNKVKLIDYEHCTEGCYNLDKRHGQNGLLCLDKGRLWSGGGSSPEPCDLYLEIDGTPTFVHVKRHETAGGYSHLFQQGLVAAESILQEKADLEKLNKELSKKNLGPVKADGEIRVVFAIITKKRIKKGSSLIPEFSRVSIRSTFRDFRRMRIQASFQYVKDVNPEKKNKINGECRFCPAKSKNKNKLQS